MEDLKELTIKVSEILFGDKIELIEFNGDHKLLNDMIFYWNFVRQNMLRYYE